MSVKHVGEMNQNEENVSTLKLNVKFQKSLNCERKMVDF